MKRNDIKWDISSDGILMDCDFNKHVSELVIPDNVKEIGDRVFCCCKNLKSVIIPESVTSIGEEAFDRCTALSNIVIPETVTRIGSWAFQDTAWLKNYPDDFVVINHILIKYKRNPEDMPEELCIPQDVYSVVDGTFDFGTKIKKLILPLKMKCIGAYAFDNCTALQEVQLPESVESIGHYAFCGCKLNRVPLLVHKGNILYQFPEKYPYPEDSEYMVQNHDYEADLVPEIKYDLIFQMFMLDIDTEGAGQYIREHFREMMPIFFRLEDTALLQKMFEHLPDLMQEYIDILIQETIEQKKHRLQIMLTDYKYQYCGFRKKDWSL